MPTKAQNYNNGFLQFRKLCYAAITHFASEEDVELTPIEKIQIVVDEIKHVYEQLHVEQKRKQYGFSTGKPFIEAEYDEKYWR